MKSEDENFTDDEWAWIKPLKEVFKNHNVTCSNMRKRLVLTFFIAVLLGGNVMAETEKITWGESWVGIMTQEEVSKMAHDQEADISHLPKIGESNPGSEWVYVGFGVLSNANNQAGFDWRNKVTGEEVSGIGAKAPDAFLKIEVKNEK